MHKSLIRALGWAAAMIVAACLQSAYALPTIYGTMSQNNSWGQWDSQEGIYSFQPVQGCSFTPVFTDDWDLSATAGGVLVDGVYHLFHDRQSSSTFAVGYTSYKIDDWTIDYSCYFSNVILSNDMAYDPVTDRVYCVQKGSGSQGKLARWNQNNIDDITAVATLPVELLAIAATADGALYGIGANGNLYGVDKTTGELTLIGATGVTPKGYQGSVIDPATGVFYWTAYTSGGKSALYTVDLATGAATKVTDFANNARFCGLYMLGDSADDNAPEAPTGFTMTFEGASNDGVAEFTMPSKTVGGATISGSLQYRIAENDVVIASGSANAGEQVTLDVTLPTGPHSLSLTASNAAGESPRAKLSIYVGKGAPGYVSYPTAAQTGTPGEIVVSWEAPDYCSPLDAYFDPTELLYSVLRLPDNVVVADHIAETSVTDHIDYDGPLSVFKYSVIAHIDELSSGEITTNGVAVGAPLTPPYDVALNSADLDLFTIIDANRDGMTWAKDWYNYGVSCGDRWGGDCDDWLILPPIHLENTGVYHLYITVGNDYDGPSRWELKIGQAPTVEGMTETLMEPASTVIGQFDDDISVAEPGTYYIGIHCTGFAGTTMYVGEIALRDVTNLDAPEAPDGVTGVGAEHGELAAYVTFTAPTKTIGGAAVGDLTAANIYHGKELVYILDNVEPGKTYTCKVKADQEFNTYSVAAVNAAGEGRRATVDYVFAGYDYPNLVTGLTLVENEEGKPALTWDSASEEGLYGYYVDPADVVYEIYRGRDGSDDYDLIETEFQGTEYVDADIDLDCDQYLLHYYIYPVNSIGRGYGSRTNSLCVGRPYAAPFVETFPAGSTKTSPWYYTTTSPETCGWSVYKNDDTSLPDCDGSNGLMAFYSTNPEDEATLCAPYVTVKGLQNPIIDFYYYSDGTLAVEPQVIANGEALDNVAPVSAGNGWARFEASLAAYTGADRIAFKFRGASDGGETYSFIDNVRVRELYAHDLAVPYISAPATLTLGEADFVTVCVKNDGSQPSQAATLTLYRNGYAVETAEIQPLEPAEQIEVTFNQMPDATFGDRPEFIAVVSYDLDMNEANDCSDIAVSSMKESRLPAPTDLRADSELDRVTLTWTAPTATSLAPEPTLEDFEDYEAFAIEMNPWTLVDGDQQATGVMADPVIWYEDLSYPHAGEAMAYQIFDPEAAGIDTETYILYRPFSGSKSAVCWSTDDWSVPNDDWLISPELFPGGQTISFHVYSRTGYFDNEKYEVLYSSTGLDTESFTLLKSGVATNAWTKITVELPADARYFAIRTVSSQSSTEVWYDDIEYIPATSAAIPLELVGFNVYRDNARLNAEPVVETSYVDTAAPTGRHKYNVTAVYGAGESAMSESVNVDAESGLASTWASGVKVIGDAGFIAIRGAEGHRIAVTAASGITIARTIAPTADYRIPLLPGVYVVTIDNTPYKVAVR